jgi:hypothetical protein
MTTIPLDGWFVSDWKASLKSITEKHRQSKLKEENKMPFNIGDVVRIGKGKVEYTVDNVQSEQYGQVLIKSQNTGKTQLVELDRLTPVKVATVPTVEDAPNEEPEPLADEGKDFPMAAWEIELAAAALNPKRPFLLTVDHVTTGYKSYGAAADALILAARAGFQHYAVIDHDGVRKVTRTTA